MSKQKKYIYILIFVGTIGLLAAFYLVNNFPGRTRPDFDLQAIAPQLTPFRDFYRAKVLSVNNEDFQAVRNVRIITQTVAVRLLTGDQKDREVQIDFQSGFDAQKLKSGEAVVVARSPNAQLTGDQEFVILDRYRLPYLGILVGLFLLLAIVFGRSRGLSSVVGLAFSIFVLVYFIAPAILAGKNPIAVTLIGAFIIAVVSIFLAHGFRQRTALAVIGTIVTLLLAEGLAYGAVRLAHLLGNGSEETFLLQGGTLGAFNLQGLLLASILIGTLGILDDVTIGQTAAVDEIRKANPQLSFKEMYSKGMSVGREHIASLINTLALAYAGAFFPLFLLIVLLNGQPLWTILNSEFIAEEIVRTLVGSSALILAVPLSTLLAAYYFSKIKNET